MRFKENLVKLRQDENGLYLESKNGDRINYVTNINVSKSVDQRTKAVVELFVDDTIETPPE